VPDWEITPDQAGSAEVILSKRNELGLLSNFAPTGFELDGRHYGSVEAFWQMMKYPEGPDDPRARAGPWTHTRAEVSQMTAFTAKSAGKAAHKHMKTLGISWLSYQGKRLDYKGSDSGRHYELIRRAMTAKMKQNADVQQVLLSTGALELLPDHRQSKNKTRAYEYHRIWMALRSEMQRTGFAAPFLPHWTAPNKKRILRAVGATIYKKHPVAVFDGDGTLWHADLPREFLDYQIQNRRLKHFDYNAAGGVARLYGTCKSDVSICIAQAAFLYVGLPLDALREDAHRFLDQGFAERVFAGQRELVSYLRSRGVHVFVVSGGPHWLAAVAAKRYFGISATQVIGVRTRIVNGHVSAEVIPPLPFRRGKANAIDTLIGHQPQIIVGNSKSDIPMLEKASLLSIAVNSFGPEHPGFHYPSEQALVREAKRRGWAVQRFQQK
jgi:phosphoserine phosphatase/predicted NAD-dependent protein-ADP-ribosyltransferase YbiA (DUF1768 family)